MNNKQVLFCFVMGVGSNIGHTAALWCAELNDDRIQNIVSGSEQITVKQFNSFLPEERDNIINKLIQYVLLDPIKDYGIVHDAEGQPHPMMLSYLQEAFFRVVASPFYWTWALAPLMDRGASLEAEYCRGGFALSQTMLNADWDNVNFLKRLGVDEAKGMEGRTALMQAAYMGNGEKVAALLALGAHPEAVDTLKNTALTIAAENDYAMVVKILVEAMANIEAVDVYSRSASYWAVYRGNFESKCALIDGYRQQLSREGLVIKGLKSAERIMEILKIPDDVLVNRFMVNCDCGGMGPADQPVPILFEMVLQQVRESIWHYLSDEDIINLSKTNCGLLMRYAIEQGRVRSAHSKQQRFAQFIQEGFEQINRYPLSYPLVLKGSNRITQMVPRSEVFKQLLQDALRQGYLVTPAVACLDAHVAQVTPMRLEQSSIEGSQVVPMQIESSESCVAREAPWLGGQVAMELEDEVVVDYYDIDGDEPVRKKTCRR